MGIERKFSLVLFIFFVYFRTINANYGREMNYLDGTREGEELDHEPSIKMGVDVAMEGPHARIVIDKPQDCISKSLQGDSVSTKGVDRIEWALSRDVSSLALTNNKHLVSMLIFLNKRKEGAGLGKWHG